MADCCIVFLDGVASVIHLTTAVTAVQWEAEHFPFASQ